MDGQLSFIRRDDQLTFTGELVSETVGNFWPQRQQAMAGVKLLSLCGLTRVDTAGLALLIHLVASAGDQPGKIILRGASDNLRTLATLYNLPEGILPTFAD